MQEELGVLDNADEGTVSRELQRQWRLIKQDAPTQAIISKLGIELSTLDQIDESPFAAEPERRGNRADVATAIIIGIGIKVGSEVAYRSLQLLWEKVIRVEIEKRFGQVINPNRQPKDE